MYLLSLGSFVICLSPLSAWTVHRSSPKSPSFIFILIKTKPYHSILRGLPKFVSKPRFYNFCFIQLSARGKMSLMDSFDIYLFVIFPLNNNSFNYIIMVEQRSGSYSLNLLTIFKTTLLRLLSRFSRV